MANSRLRNALQQVRSAILASGGGGLSDAQLLGYYVERQDEAAFEALVRRHGPMVMGVCCRVLGNRHDAEDAFQATFLVLVRKAASLTRRERLAGWLYGVAHQTSRKARATIARRRGKEKQVATMPEPEVVHRDAWPELEPLLDEELSRLPEKYRVPIVLCDLEGKTRKEAARHLGWPEGTVAGRLARGRAMLAKRLARRGLAVSGASLTAILSQTASSASVSPFVLSSTVQAARLFAAGPGTGAISAKVIALTQGVLKAMLLSKLTTTTLVVSALLLVGVTATVGTFTIQAAGQARLKNQDTPSPATAKADKAVPASRALYGNWSLIRAEAEGTNWYQGNAVSWYKTVCKRWHISPKDITVCLADEHNAVFLTPRYKIDESKTPKAIDIMGEGAPGLPLRQPILSPVESDTVFRVQEGGGVPLRQPILSPVESYVARGIFRLEGDELTICVTASWFSTERPKQFAAKEGSPAVLLVFKRDRSDTNAGTLSEAGTSHTAKPAASPSSKSEREDTRTSRIYTLDICMHFLVRQNGEWKDPSGDQRRRAQYRDYVPEGGQTGPLLSSGGPLEVEGPDGKPTLEERGFCFYVRGITYRKDGKVWVNAMWERKEPTGTAPVMEIQGQYVRSVKHLKPGEWATLELTEEAKGRKYQVEFRVVKLTDSVVKKRERDIFNAEE